MASSSPSLEKADIVLEEQANPAPFEEDPLPPEGSDERILAERRLVRKLDMRVLPTIVLIFIMNYIDRNAVTTARLKGLEQDLHLSDLQYNVVLSILYVSYCPAQIPSNMALNWITRPSLYIGTCVVIWGLISTLTGITQSYGGILAIRLCIGIPESAFYPGGKAIYLLSRWYTKKELAFRSAILYGGLLISNAFGALMAAGILANMEGKLGIRAWRWVFFIEGSITMFIGLNAMWLLPDYPINTRWVSPKDRRLAQARLADDAGEADKDSTGDSPLKGLLMAIQDPKVWVFAIMNTAQLLGLSFVNFFPTLTSTLGFSTTVSLLLAAPPWILSTITCCLNAWHADRTGGRFFHQSAWWWGVMVGFIISLATNNNGARYFSMFLMACGYGGFAMTLVWVSSTFPRPPAKRAAIIGIVNGVGNIGNLMGSYTWKAEWGPDYHQSMIISFVALVISTILSLILRQWVIRDNKKLDEDEKRGLNDANRARVEEAARLEGITFDQAMQRRKGFRYLY
ncbi:major facilitator superfamily domain-containing protein [Lentinula lateritia]|uniref:Major facilitator superfamily domain-containing protein n=1 Tax=Lentinula aff. lateritia TaxID=2804960 RepID=A0ACC1U9V2_9AGAR|nr:major facilitator superfamily domain-containing protein [Lentinula aff. lateritia]KAJ3855698.1 major facilitator superfamily domain-containing protein [Lentinula lateritia]